MHPEIQYRVVENLLLQMGGNDSPLRQKNIKDFIEKNKKNPIFKGASIGNCLLRPYQKKWLVIREPEKITDTQPAGPTIFWDNRFLIQGLKNNENFYVAALGKNWVNYKDFFASLSPLPSYFWQTIPALYDKNGIALEILVQNRENSGTLSGQFKIEFSPYSTQYKSVYDLRKRITL
jgi:hypothetical protein